GPPGPLHRLSGGPPPRGEDLCGADRHSGQRSRGGRHVSGDDGAAEAAADAGCAAADREVAGRGSRQIPHALPPRRRALALVFAADDGRCQAQGQRRRGLCRRGPCAGGGRHGRARLHPGGRMPDPLPRPGAGACRARAWPVAVRTDAGAGLAIGGAAGARQYLHARSSRCLAGLPAGRVQGLQALVRELPGPAHPRPAAHGRRASDPGGRLGSAGQRAI
ncbi:MAG: Histone acetyltransferase HPA2 and related acetyltransferases, partial [uncultured Sphingosinicella sp.]